jgi:hypothetical protein
VIHPVNADAKLYSETYDDATLFQICAICGSEGSRKKSSPVPDIEGELHASGIAQLYEEILHRLKNTENSTTYDKIFASQLEENFTNGLLNGISNVCFQCVNQLPIIKIPIKKKSAKSNTNSVGPSQV